jgi:ABC-2 type transport system ATP-binding protein
MDTLVRASGLTKRYGRVTAVDSIDFEIGPGRIVGLIGPNGAGKSTTLKAILGLIRYHGDLQVLGQDPRSSRAALMQRVSYMSDVASLPDWMRVDQLLALMQASHPAFDRRRTLNFLARTEITGRQKIRHLSKGMKTQLHLAVIMGIEASLLILDEPTLGLDIIHRTEFYAQLLDEYYDQETSILVTTHQIEEVEHLLTDIIFIEHGRIILNMPVTDIDSHFAQLHVPRNQADAARALQPLYESDRLDEAIMIFENVDRARLAAYGKVSSPGLADLFVACVKGNHHA